MSLNLASWELYNEETIIAGRRQAFDTLEEMRRCRNLRVIATTDYPMYSITLNYPRGFV